MQIVFVDWDGTAVQSKLVYYESIVECFRRYGKRPPTLEEFGNDIGALGSFQAFYDKYGLPELKESEAIKIRAAYVDRNWHRIVPTAGFKSFLGTCAAWRLPVAVLSNNDEPVIRRKIKEYNLGKYIHRVAAVSDKADFLGNLIAMEGFKPSEMVHIDDTKEGLLAANTFGVRTIAFTGGLNTKERLFEANPDFPIRKNGTMSDMDDFFKVTEIISKLRS